MKPTKKQHLDTVTKNKAPERGQPNNKQTNRKNEIRRN